MAISFDSAASASTGSATSHTISSHAVGSGTNRYLLVGFTTQNGSNIATGVTHNGTAMTKLHQHANNPSGFSTEIWGLAAPDEGTFDIVVTLSSADNIEFCSASYFGVDSTQPDATATASAGSGTNLTGTATTVADNAWLTMMGRNNATAYTAGSGTTVRATAGASAICDSGADLTPAGSHSVIMTSGAGTAHGGTVVSLAPASGGGGSGSSLSLNSKFW